MCYTLVQKSELNELKHRFKTKNNPIDFNIPIGIFIGFTFPQIPVIACQQQDTIQLMHWGLLPNWTNDINFRKNTLNAQIESINQKPSFKPYVNNRCLILTNGFYEWKWLDEKGKKKEKYRISLSNEMPFAMGGIYNIWVNKQSGEEIKTFTIITLPANEQMATIHNTKKRMPLILTEQNEMAWLNGEDPINFNNIPVLNTIIEK